MNTSAAAWKFTRSALALQSQTPTPSPTKAGTPINAHLVIFAASAALALATASECHSITHPASLLYGAVLWLWWGGASSVLWKLAQRRRVAVSFSPRTILVHLLAGSMLGVVHLLMLGSLGILVPEWRTHASVWAALTAQLNINRFGMEVLLYGFIFGITGVVQFQVQSQREAMKSLELQKQLSAAHLRALQMQLEPHFLFNTLNAITTLVELGRQKEAAEMLFHLNAILKSTLKRTTPEKVPLSQEIENIENYLAIEQVRFVDRLRIEIKVEPDALHGLVPCFLLQPIVENAIRHGIAHCENEGLIEASVKRDGDSLHLRVRDSGPGVNVTAAQDGHGIGLRNTRERLAHFYDESYAMQAQFLPSGGFEVAIQIPYERHRG